MPEPCDHDSRPLFEKLIGPIRARARELGYAIGVHGTLKRDIDLIAAPWSDEVTGGVVAADAATLAYAIQAVCRELNDGKADEKHPDDRYFREGCPGSKPHGRRVWSFYLGGGPYIDLSVMPRAGREEVVYED